MKKIRHIIFSYIIIPFAAFTIIIESIPVFLVIVMTFLDSLEDTHPSIEKNGLEGCDTVPLPGDKEQLATAFMANLDSIWNKINKFNKDVKPIDTWDSVNDPALNYTYLCFKYYKQDEEGKYELLTVNPSKFYKAVTHLVLYSKDKLLCMAFIVLRNELFDGSIENEPYYDPYLVIGKRSSIEHPFKVFIRNESEHYWLYTNDISDVKSFENDILYKKGYTYLCFDVYPVNDIESLPVLSDPDFFEKHPLFDKFNDSTYNFEWYRVERQSDEFFKYDYPY